MEKKMANKRKRSKIKFFKSLVKKYNFQLTPLKGKDPFINGWQKIKRPFKEDDFIGYNAGVVCGPLSGVIVLDIDDVEAFEILIKELKLKIFKTLVVKTGSGKPHNYYLYPDNDKKYPCRSLKHPIFGYTIFDIKSLGGQVVAPGSVHPDTKQFYSITDDVKIAKAPLWIKKYSKDRKGINADILLNYPPSPEYYEGGLKLLKLPNKIRKAILKDHAAGKRSEAIAQVICSMVKKGIEDKKIVYIFDFYPIGIKYRTDKKQSRKWLQAEIDRAKGVVKPTKKRSPVKYNKKTIKNLAAQILVKQTPTEKFDTSVLPHVLRDYVDFLCETTDADPIMITMSVLGTISGFMKTNVSIKEGVYFQKLYPNLWMVAVADSGSFKSTALRKGAKLALQRGKMIEEVTAKLKQKLYTLKSNGGKDKKDKVRALEDQIKASENSDAMLPDRTTPESLFEHLSDGNGGLLLISEFGPWLETMEKKYNIGLKGLLTDLYDIPPRYSIKTKTGGHLKINNPFISIAGVSTLPWIEKNMKIEDVAVGFLARFLMFYPPMEKTIPKALPSNKKLNNPAESELQDLLDNIPDSKEYGLSKEAKALYKQIHSDLYKMDNVDEKRQNILKPFVKRWSPYLLKLAMIMQYCMNPKKDKITAAAVKSANAVLTYAITSTKLLFQNDLGQSEHQQKCTKVLKYVAKQGGKVTRSQLQRSHTLDGGNTDYEYVLSSLIMGNQVVVDTTPDRKGDWLYLLKS